MKLFTIFDMKAEVYARPFYALTDGEAVRTFTDAVNTDESPYNRHPEDYTLFSVAEFDDRLGKLTPHPMQLLVHAINCIAVEPTPLFNTGD